MANLLTGPARREASSTQEMSGFALPKTSKPEKREEGGGEDEGGGGGGKEGGLSSFSVVMQKGMRSLVLDTKVAPERPVYTETSNSAALSHAHHTDCVFNNISPEVHTRTRPSVYSPCMYWVDVMGSVCKTVYEEKVKHHNWFNAFLCGGEGGRRWNFKKKDDLLVKPRAKAGYPNGWFLSEPFRSPWPLRSRIHNQVRTVKIPFDLPLGISPVDFLEALKTKNRPVEELSTSIAGLKSYFPAKWFDPKDKAYNAPHIIPINITIDYESSNMPIGMDKILISREADQKDEILTHWSSKRGPCSNQFGFNKDRQMPGKDELDTMPNPYKPDASNEVKEKAYTDACDPKRRTKMYKWGGSEPMNSDEIDKFVERENFHRLYVRDNIWSPIPSSRYCPSSKDQDPLFDVDPCLNHPEFGRWCDFDFAGFRSQLEENFKPIEPGFEGMYEFKLPRPDVNAYADFNGKDAFDAKKAEAAAVGAWLVLEEYRQIVKLSQNNGMFDPKKSDKLNKNSNMKDWWNYPRCVWVNNELQYRFAVSKEILNYIIDQKEAKFNKKRFAMNLNDLHLVLFPSSGFDAHKQLALFLKENTPNNQHTLQYHLVLNLTYEVYERNADVDTDFHARIISMQMDQRASLPDEESEDEEEEMARGLAKSSV